MRHAINSPQVENTLYVDAENGDDLNDGSTEGKALKTLKKASKLVNSKSEIIVKNGEYTNSNYGTGKKDNGIVLNIMDKSDILITNYPGHTPIIRFDGTGGISMSEVCKLE